MSENEYRWRARPVLSAGLRVVVYVVPVVVSFVTAYVVSRIVSRPPGILGILAWGLVVIAASSASMVVFERLARRLLPLTVLLRLSLLFPGPPPSRLGVARRGGSVRQLERWLEHTRADGAEGGLTRTTETILTLVAALNAHDPRTRGHCERVRAFGDLLAEELKLADVDRDRLRWASLLHDVGKLSVTAALLNKPGTPDEREWEALRRHPDEGARLAAPLVAWLGDWAEAIPQHHERHDGLGYPRGLAGHEISLGARIVAVADSYDTMTAVRPYKKPMSPVAAREELARCAGSQFDPAVVRAFLNISLRRVRWIVGPLAWLAQLPVVGVLPQAGAQLGGAAQAAATYGRTATVLTALATSSTLGLSSAARAGAAPSRDTGRGRGATTTFDLVDGTSATVSEPEPVTAPPPVPPPPPAPAPPARPAAVVVTPLDHRSQDDQPVPTPEPAPASPTAPAAPMRADPAPRPAPAVAPVPARVAVPAKPDVKAPKVERDDKGEGRDGDGRRPHDDAAKPPSDDAAKPPSDDAAKPPKDDDPATSSR